MRASSNQSHSSQKNDNSQQLQTRFHLSKEQHAKMQGILPCGYALVRPIDLNKHQASKKQQKSPIKESSKKKTSKKRGKRAENVSIQELDEPQMQKQDNSKQLKKCQQSYQPMQQDVNILGPKKNVKRTNRFVQDNYQIQTAAFQLQEESIDQKESSKGKPTKKNQRIKVKVSQLQRASLGMNIGRLSSNDLQLLCHYYCPEENQEIKGKTIFYNLDLLSLSDEKAWEMRQYVINLLRKADLQYEQLQRDSQDDFVIEDDSDEQAEMSLKI